MKNSIKMTKKINNQRGIIKEIIVIMIVIFILAYFNIDPQNLVDKFMDWFNTL